ncbi:MAG: hypothetical protein ABW168_16155 [Sedimenticola sp.]
MKLCTYVRVGAIKGLPVQFYGLKFLFFTGLISGHYGKCPNNTIAEAVRSEAMGLIQTHYSIDFSPAFAREKLTEIHKCCFSVETLRKWMIADGL